MTQPLFETPNLDDLSVDPQDLIDLGNVFRGLAEYCRYKAQAMKARAAGNIRDAQHNERQAERRYYALPTEYRW